MEGSINLHEKSIFRKKIIDSWNLWKLYEDTEAFRRSLWI